MTTALEVWGVDMPSTAEDVYDMKHTYRYRDT
jgi:hypothetical protein